MQIEDGNKTKSNIMPPCSPSMRGRMKNTNDGIAVAIFVIFMSVIAILSVLSVMNNKTEVKGEGGNTKINEVKERIFRIFK